MATLDAASQEATRPTPRWIVCAAGIVAAAGYAFLCVRSHEATGAALEDLWVATGTGGIAIGMLAWRRARFGEQPRPRDVLAFAALFLAIGVIGEPVLEDDPARYRLDGWVFATEGSPYGRPPSTFFDRDVPDDVAGLLDQVNHPDLPTIYGPTLQWIFRAAHGLAGTALWPIQLAVALATFALLVRIGRRADPLALAFVAWHPLVVKEFAFTAHPDVIAVLLLSIALDRRGSSAGLAGFFFALAVGAKLFALLAGPWLLWRAPRACAAAGLTLLVLYGPFLPTWVGGFALDSDPHAAMALDFLFNSPLHLVGQSLLGPFATRGVLGTALVACIALAWWRRADVADTPDSNPGVDPFPGELVFGAMLLASPVVNAWYMIWPLAFIVRWPSVAIGVASYAVLAAYAHGLHLARPDLAPYEIPNAVLAAEWSAIALGLGVDVLRRVRTRASA